MPASTLYEDTSRNLPLRPPLKLPTTPRRLLQLLRPESWSNRPRLTSVLIALLLTTITIAQSPQQPFFSPSPSFLQSSPLPFPFPLSTVTVLPVPPTQSPLKVSGATSLPVAPMASSPVSRLSRCARLKLPAVKQTSSLGHLLESLPPQSPGTLPSKTSQL